MSRTILTSQQIADRRMRTIVRQLSKIADDGFDLAILVELTTAGRPAPVYYDDGERQALTDLYAESAGLKPRSAAARRGEAALREFLREKAGAL